MSRTGFRQTAEDITLNLLDEAIRRGGEDSGVSRALRIASRMVRKRAAMETMQSYIGEPWMKRLLECQEEVARCGAIPYYLNQYRGQEISFWLNIPRWIYENRTITHVERGLDIGCAYGTLALFCKRLFDCEIYCLDMMTSKQIESLTKKNGMSFTVNNIELDPFPWNLKFDLITFTEVLEHLNFNPAPTLLKIRDHLTDNGRLYLSTPDAAQWGRIRGGHSSWKDIPNPKKGLPLTGGHMYQYCKDELFHVVGEVGLDVEKFDYAPGFGARHLNVCLRRA
jgi:2-polyprenyl-3-methyl-5-hydroxy-6-metoxy-1,4-benzoquinol methylase